MVTGNVGASLLLVTQPGAYRLTVDGMAFVSEKHPAQTIIVEVNNAEIATWTFDLSSPAGVRTADIPRALAQDGTLRILLRSPGSMSPSQLGISTDERVLGLGVRTITLSAMP